MEEGKKALKKKKNILNLVIWILALIAMALIAGLTCFRCGKNFCENQFIDATVFGFFIVLCIWLLSIFVSEEIPEKTMLGLCFLGAVMYLISAILLFVYMNDTYYGFSGHLDNTKGRTMGAMILCLFTGILLLFEFIVGLAKPDILE